MAKVLKSFRVPQETSDRMSGWDFNWSEFVGAAIERQLCILEQEYVPMSTIERLRASKQQLRSEQFMEGERFGREWANRSAEYAQLKRLSKLRDTVEDWDEWFVEDETGVYGVCELLVEAIEPPGEFNRQVAADFWKDALDGEGPEEDPDFVQGFAEGALAVFDSVEDEL